MISTASGMLATVGGLNSKLHAVCNGEERPVVMLAEGQMSGPKRASILLPVFFQTFTF